MPWWWLPGWVWCGQTVAPLGADGAAACQGRPQEVQDNSPIKVVQINLNKSNSAM